MSKRSFQEDRGPLRIVVQEPLEIPKQLGESLMRRWYKRGVGRSRSAQPALAPPEFARVFIAPAAACEQDPVNFLQQPKGQRKSLPDPPESMIQRRDIVRDFSNIYGRGGEPFLGFK